jgi:sugar phosphate isomerase/epimerase
MPPRLTYCSNVHAAPDLPSALRLLATHVAPVAAAARAAGRPFGLGGWWPLPVVDQLARDDGARAEYAATLQQIGAPLWTLNVFPVDGFHDAVVKTAVYRPDWAHEDRLTYTRLCAEVGASMVPAGSEVPLSSLPLGYQGVSAKAPDYRLMARNLARCASAFAAIEQATGVRCVLALEPEPDCVLETCAAAATFLEKWLFDEGAWTVSEALLRRHVGVCVDLCHLAVVDEEPLAALSDLRQRGIAVPKIQVSACLELRDGQALDQLLAFDEPRYLHQTVGSGLRALDLPQVAHAREDFRRAPLLRSHYHVPLFWDPPGPLGSTAKAAARVLAAIAAEPGPWPLLEVETYTWSVLGAGAAGVAASAPLHQLIARELDQAAHWLDAPVVAPPPSPR